MLPKRRPRTPPTAVHCGYHKCMTVYFHRMLRAAAELTGRPFATTVDTDPDDLPQTGFILDHESRLDPDRFDKARLTHIIRDPRDLVISGYFYHRRTHERWCTEPLPDQPELPDNISYQDHLNAVPKEEGLLFEMRNVSGRMIELMQAWDYNREDVLELRYEDLIGNERKTFRRIFAWYGLDWLQRHRLVKLAAQNSLSAIRRNPGDEAAGHIRRNSRIGQWRDHFTDRVKDAFKERYGQALVELGYERGFSW